MRCLVRPGQQCVNARCRQSLAIQLAVGAQRHLVQVHIKGRHHVIGQLRAQGLAQGLDGQQRAGVIGNQSLAARWLVTHQHHGLLNVWVGGQAGLNITRLDTQSVDFHLIVVAPQKLQHAVRPLTHQIATAVQAVATNKRAVDETLGIRLRQVQVTACHTGPANVQLAAHPQRHGMVLHIEHIQAGVADRPTDGQYAAWHGLMRLQGPDAAIHRGFGRAIYVVQAHLRQPLA